MATRQYAGPFGLDVTPMNPTAPMILGIGLVTLALASTASATATDITEARCYLGQDQESGGSTPAASYHEATECELVHMDDGQLCILYEETDHYYAYNTGEGGWQSSTWTTSQSLLCTDYAEPM